jgi:hypothetical protein
MRVPEQRYSQPTLTPESGLVYLLYPELSSIPAHQLFSSSGPVSSQTYRYLLSTRPDLPGRLLDHRPGELEFYLELVQSGLQPPVLRSRIPACWRSCPGRFSGRRRAGILLQDLDGVFGVYFCCCRFFGSHTEASSWLQVLDELVE